MSVMMRQIWVSLLLTWLLTAQALAMTPEQARHLLLRVGFGPTPEQVQQLAGTPLTDVLDRWLSPNTQAPAPPAFAAEPPWHPPEVWRDMSEEDRQAYRQIQNGYRNQLKEWWLEQMLTTSAPLQERMTLFWHGHFTSSLKKVNTPVLMYRQNLLFRDQALGSFADLLRAVARDPAMLIYLDNNASRKAQPNENFARELLELFTLGEGHYSEADVKAAARAFTGWTTQRHVGTFVLNAKIHDTGEKQFLGVRGNLTGDDILTSLLAHPRTAQHLVEKLWREFISPVPDENLVREWAQLWREEGYAMVPLLRRILTSDAFWDERHRGSLVKSPVEFVLGTVRLLDLSSAYQPALAAATRNQGQDLFDPPNVKGWPNGEAWIDARTLLARQGFVHQAMRGRKMQDDKDAGDDASRQRIAALVGGPGIAGLQRLLLPVAAVQPIAARTAPQGQLTQLLLDPAWQLK